MAKRVRVEACQEKVQKLLDEGEFYTAQQMYQTFTFRFVKRKDYESAVALLRIGVNALLDHNQYHSASELGSLYIKQLDAGDRALDDETANNISSIFEKFCQAGETTLQEQNKFIREAITWSRKFRSDATPQTHPGLKGTVAYKGCPRFLVLYGDALMRRGEYAAAQEVYAQGGHVDKAVGATFKFASGLPQSDLDLALCRQVLFFLSEGNLKLANAAFSTVDEALFPAYKAPLVNFCKFLLLTLEYHAGDLFASLRTRYRPSLERDPALMKQLDKIGHIFYGIKPQGDMISNLLSSFLA